MGTGIKKNGLSVKKRQSQLRGIWRRLRRNKAAMLGLIVIVLLILCSVFAPFIAPYGYDDQLLSRRFIFPCKEFPFGTDNLGRDILSRVIYGSRISLAVGLVSVSISAVFGTILGSVAGYYGNVTDNVIMRAIDIVLSIPSILLAISIAAMLGQGLFNLMIAIGVATAILDAAGLSFIGLGIQPPIPDWGGMLSAGRQYIRDYWYIVTFPGLMIMMTIYSLNLFGDGLRDALDPRLKN